MSIFQYDTLQNAKVILQIPVTDTSQDALVSLLLSRLSQAIESYARRIFGPQQYVDILSGTGTPELWVRQRPILNVSAVYLDPMAYFGDSSDAFNPSTTQITEGAQGGFAVEWDSGPGSQSSNGLLLMISDIWPRVVGTTFGLLTQTVGPPQGNIKVEYVAGFMGTPWYTTTGTTNGTTTVTGVAVSATTPVAVGMTVAGTGIPNGTYVAAISGTTLTLSQAALTSGTPSLTFSIPAPGDVQMALDLMVAYTKNIGKWGQAVTSASYDGASISFDQTGRLGLMSEAVTTLLAPYVNQGVA